MKATKHTEAATLINKAFLAASKPLKRYAAIIASGTIGERDIIAMRSFMGKNKENARAIFTLLDGKELELSPDQNMKGIQFLNGLRTSQTGRERKNNPFGYREADILDNFDRFTLSGLYNAGNAYVDFYLPLYTCYSKDGSGFEYYYQGGKIHIVG
jgi:hypothetical protein